MRPRVLVIEDRDYLRHVLVAILQDYGYPALGIGSAAVALERLPELRPLLILLDMHMPDMDGHEFLRHLRGNPLWAEVPVLIVSAFGQAVLPSTDRRTLAVLQKPFDHHTLIAYVEEMIGPAVTLRAGA